MEAILEQPSITFLNGSGDITITWDEHNKEQIIEMIKKKMKEGYTFFTTKKIPLVKLYRRVKVNEDNLDKCDAVIIDDVAFEKMVQSMDDRDVAAQVRSGNVDLAKFEKVKFSPLERHRATKVAAYLLAEKNGFQGNPADYWAEAKRQLTDESKVDPVIERDPAKVADSKALAVRKICGG